MSTSNATDTQYHFKVMVRPAILSGGQLWFPQRLTREFLEAQRRRDPHLFSILYQNEPISPEEQRFRREWIVYEDFFYKWEDSPRIVLRATGEEIPVYVTTCVDPAISSERYADFTGITTLGCTPDDIWYVFSARRIRGGSDRVAAACIEEVREFRPQRFGVETVAFQVALKDIIRRDFDESALVVPIKELKSGTNKGKRVRIEALVPRFAEGRVYFHRDVDTALEEELLSWRPWDEAAHDDLVDSLSHHESLSLPAPRSGLVTPPIDEFDLAPHQRPRHRTGEESGRDPMTGYSRAI